MALAKHARIDVDSLPKDELEVSTITLYQSEVGINRGTIIAVNAEYICYAIRGELPAAQGVARRAPSRPRAGPVPPCPPRSPRHALTRRPLSSRTPLCAPPPQAA